MSDIELQAEKRALIREQDLWAQKKVDADRYLKRLHAEIATLEPKAADLRNDVAQLKEQVKHYDETCSERLAYISTLQADTEAYEKRLSEIDDKLTSVQQHLASEQASIDRKLREYTDSQKILLQEEETVLREDLDALYKKRNELSEVLAFRKIEIAALRDSYRTEEVNLKNQVRLLTDDKDTLINEIKKLEADISDLDRAKLSLSLDNTALQDGNNLLYQKNLEFKSYEVKAWRQLHATDAALQERERAITEREQYHPQTRSFLPPTSE